MKVKVIAGKVHLVAENDMEAQRFIDMSQNIMPQGGVSKVPKKPKAKRARKYPIYRDCDICHKSCRGALGLGLHKRIMHGIVSPQTLKNQARQRYMPPAGSVQIPVQQG